MADELPAVTILRGARWRLLLIYCSVGLVAYLLLRWYSPVPSERLYPIGPPLLLLHRLLIRRSIPPSPGGVCFSGSSEHTEVPRVADQPHLAPAAITRIRFPLSASTGLMLCIGLAIAAYDNFGPPGVWQRGQITRVLWCFCGLILALGMIRRTYFTLGHRLLPRHWADQLPGRLLLLTGWLALLIAILQPYLLSYMQVHPLKRRATTDPLTACGLKYTDIAWHADDGTTLRGWWIPADHATRTAIVCHGVMDERSGMTEFASQLVAGGYNVLLYDHRGHGASDRWTVTYGTLESSDLRAALDFLQQQYPEQTCQFVGVGWSMGAATLLLAAADDPRLLALHLESPYAEVSDMARQMTLSFPVWYRPWAYAAGMTLADLEAGVRLDRVSPTTAAAKIAPRPLRIIHGTSDHTIPLAQGQRVFQAAREPKEFVAVEMADHCECADIIGIRYYGQMLQFLDHALDEAHHP
ncbi:MAG: hypothetical protein HJJLKODD_00842 [Phycisphaerae bacterium]|nr:hypothetical protein [Phycisphaerae bacterium]